MLEEVLRDAIAASVKEALEAETARLHALADAHAIGRIGHTLDIQGVAKYLQCGVSTVRRMMLVPSFPKPHRVSGRQLIWFTADIVDWVRKQPAN